VSEQKQFSVLVIDDELGPRESLRILLKHEFNVTCAASVDEGIEAFKTIHPETVIMDIRMPGADGITGLRKIRELDPEVSVVMLTGYGSLETAQEALRKGATDYLKKPFDTAQMQEAVRKYTARTDVLRRQGEKIVQLEKMNGQLLETTIALEQRAELGRFSSELMHDIRNPLTVVLGCVELLADQIRDMRPLLGMRYEAMENYLNSIIENAQRCSALTKNWSDMKKGHSAARTPVHMQRLIEDLCRDAKVMSADQSVQIATELKLNGSHVFANRFQLSRVFMNLITNALQALPEKDGSIHIVGKHQDGMVTIGIIDNGRGIEPELIGRITEPYFTTRGDSGGTGLGLAMVKTIVEEYEGTLEIKSRPGEGTEVWIGLPVFSDNDILDQLM